MRKTLEIIHSCGVAHGDIARRNLVVSKDGIPYLIDFGLSQLDPSKSVQEDDWDQFHRVFGSH